jgi:hypothetical protein
VNGKRVLCEYYTKLAKNLQTKYYSGCFVGNRTRSVAKGLESYCVDKDLFPHSIAKADRYNNSYHSSTRNSE